MTEQVIFNKDTGRYEMDVNGDTVFANVKRDGDILHIKYVEAPESLRGTGAAGRFMQGLMEIVRAEGVKVIPICGYAASWLHRHADYHDLIAE